MANFAGVDTAFAGRYVIERELGRGGAAIVYLARDLKCDREVAIKLLRPELTGVVTAERFLREIKLAATLQHPHIVPLYDSGDVDGTLYYVMPFVRGESLRQRLTRKGQLPIDNVLSLLRTLANALQYAHNSGVLHRDIKPENILLQEDQPLLADFGVALALGSARDERLTETGLSIGTPHYMSPEQAAGERALTPQTDIYSLGAIAYEMLVGEPPITRPSARVIISRVITDPPRSIQSARQGVPANVESAVLRALAKAPVDRYPSADAFARAITEERHAEALSDLAARTRHQHVTGNDRGRRPNHAVQWLAFASAATFLGGAAWWTAHRATANEPPIHGIAVLPLANLMGQDQDYFVEGMHDALIGELSQIRALNTVISRTSVMRYKSTNKSIPEIARELGVDAVVEGSVFRARDSVRIQVNVIGVLPYEHQLWRGSFDGDMRNALALQNNVVSAIAGEIRVRLTPREEAHLASARTVNPAAYQLYLKGRYRLYPSGEPELLQALEDFRQAIAIDSTFAPAYAGLARAYTWLGAWGSTIPPEVVRGPARTAALQSIALDSTLAEAYVALGQIKWLFDWNWAGADTAFRRGMKLNPPATELYVYADYLTSMGRFEEALAMERRAVQRDPLSPLGYMGLELALMCERNYAEALQQARKGLELAPNFGIGHAIYAEASIFHGDLDEAAKHTERAEQLWREAGDRSWLAYLVWGYAQEHRRADALRVLNEMDPTPAIWKAVAYAGLADTTKALDALEQAYERHEVPMVYINVRHVLDPVRNQPRFQRVLRRMNFPIELWSNSYSNKQ